MFRPRNSFKLLKSLLIWQAVNFQTTLLGSEVSFQGEKQKVLEYTDLKTWCHYHCAKQGRKRRTWNLTNKDHNNMWFKGSGGIYWWGQLNGYEGRGEGGSVLGWSGRMSDLNWAQLIVDRRKQQRCAITEENLLIIMGEVVCFYGQQNQITCEDVGLDLREIANRSFSSFQRRGYDWKYLFLNGLLLPGMWRFVP